jgi:hypothetical protein
MSSAAAASQAPAASTPAPLSLKTLKAEQHLVLSAMRKLGTWTTSSALAKSIQEAAKPNPTRTITMAIPEFVSQMDEARAAQVMDSFVDGGWAVRKDLVWSLRKDVVDQAIYSSVSQSRTEAQLQQYIVGALVNIYHRSCGEKQASFQKFVYFHHLTCVLGLSAKTIGSKLREWAHSNKRFGPFPIKLSQDIKVDVTAHIEERDLSDRTTVFRLVTKPVVAAAAPAPAPAPAVEIYRNHCPMSWQNPEMTEAELVSCARNGGGRGAADGAMDIF